MLIRTITSAALSFTLIQSVAFAQVSGQSPEAGGNTGKALQRIEGKLDRVLDTTVENKRTFVDQPLGARQQGIEFNLFRLLLWDEGEKALSGTYSRFYADDNVEIAIPFMYSSGRQHSYAFGSAGQPSGFATVGDLESYTVDMHYRKYLGHRLDGFYLSGFTRVAHLNGALEQNVNEPYRTDSETKLGVGVGIGYRIFSRSGLYWGMSLNVGRYLTGDSDVFEDSDSASADIDDSSIIVDIEFFKFGYAF